MNACRIGSGERACWPKTSNQTRGFSIVIFDLTEKSSAQPGQSLISDKLMTHLFNRIAAYVVFNIGALSIIVLPPVRRRGASAHRLEVLATTYNDRPREQQ